MGTQSVKIGITGASGLIGWHLRSFLNGVEDVKVVVGTRETFDLKEALAKFVSSSDVIVHLAGAICGDEDVLLRTNRKLAEGLINACKLTNNVPHIIFASSTHIYRDTAYGRSKKECSDIFRQWSNTSGASFTNLILPNVFGEGGKPFYNSVVSTFCHQLAHNEEPRIIDDIALELLHAQDAASEIYNIIDQCRIGDIQLQGIDLTVRDLLHKLKNLFSLYQQHLIPAMASDFDRSLFNTLRAYLYPEHYPRLIQIHQDKRGNLFEAVKSLGGGQTFISSTRQGITRGNHYHRRKIERFLVLKGCAEIKVRRLFSEHVELFAVNGDRPCYIDIPTLHTHNITNTGNDDLVTLFWGDQIFDPNNPDTFPEDV